MPGSERPFGAYSFLMKAPNFAYAGTIDSRIAARTAAESRARSAGEKSFGNFWSGCAKGESSGLPAAIPSHWAVTFSSRKRGGIRPSAIPLRIWTTV